jgi:hypothetical protein
MNQTIELRRGGVEVHFDTNEVFIICQLCGKRVYWMKRDLNLDRRHPLPEGWSSVRGFGIFCNDPICDNYSISICSNPKDQ